MKKFPDIWEWLCGLPPSSQWPGGTASLQLCTSPNTPISLSLVVETSVDGKALEGPVTFSLVVIVDSKSTMCLWKSEPCPSAAQEKTFSLLLNVIDTIMLLGPETENSIISTGELRMQRHIHLAILQQSSHYKTIFNCSFVCLCLCMCVYEAPSQIRSWSLELLERQMEEAGNHVSVRLLLQALSPSMDEAFMRSLGYIITHRKLEQARGKAAAPITDEIWEKSIRTPFTYSYSSNNIDGFWRVKAYAPLLSMKAEKIRRHHHSGKKDDQDDESPRDDRLLYALRYQQMEATIQLRYSVNVLKNSIEVNIGVHNVRCVVSQLASAEVMKANGASNERHFPSRVCLYVAPEEGSALHMVSPNLSSENPVHEMRTESTWQTVFVPPKGAGVTMGSSESYSVNIKPWRHEQWVDGRRGKLEWTLYDPTNGKEVASVKPSKMVMMQPKAWFKDRYLTGVLPFTKEGGVVFSYDKYPHSITWRLNRDMEGKTMRWEIVGRIFVTYWPNHYFTFYCETRSLEFREIVELPMVQTFL
eukprot:Gb_40607 [translate_table: standard]